MEMGYIVIRFHHQADWNEIFRRHPDIFGTPAQSTATASEVAICTVQFEKPDNAPFDSNDCNLCRLEVEGALRKLIEPVSLPQGVSIGFRFAGDGTSSYWVEYVAISSMLMSLVSSAPVVMNLLADLLGPMEHFAFQIAASLSETRDWLKSAAWRMTPQIPGEVNRPRPGCLGYRKHLDRRTKRCKECGFLNECVNTVEAS